jgi:hypothetical protein
MWGKPIAFLGKDEYMCHRCIEDPASDEIKEAILAQGAK